LRGAQALDFLGQVRPVERQVRADPGRLSQRTRLLGPANKILLAKLRGTAGHILSQISEPFFKVILTSEQINLVPKSI
jgi:hypothetical protein